MVSGKSFDLSMLWTIEGQFQFVLAPKMKSDVIIDDIAYQWPKFTNTVTVSGPGVQRSPFGKFNSNAEPNIVVLGPSSAAFDQRVYFETLQEVVEVLYNTYEYTNEMSLFDLKKTYSKDLHGFGIVDAIIVLFFLCVISAIIFGIAMTIRQYHADPRVRQLFLESSAIHALTVRWQSNKREEDQLELLSSEIDDAVLTSDEEHSPVITKDEYKNFTNISFTERKHQENDNISMEDSVL
ncbi:hypothetical protein Tcan_08512 [Toxocara canis]|uniref:Uncharacterized protein n=1 Tax=Toxocara canis TaxID=6265 RepID=A0A0B2VIH1_TOXCA|nr:hypothetical protein Tcan_08512 [Toxocara canis]